MPCTRSALIINEKLEDMASAAERNPAFFRDGVFMSPGRGFRSPVELPTSSVCAVRLVVMTLTCPAKIFKQALKNSSVLEIADFLLVAELLDLKVADFVASERGEF